MVATSTRTVQVGLESTWGTAVAATAKLMQIKDASFNIDDKTEVLRELGKFGPSANAVQVWQAGKGKVSGYATYEDLPYYLDGIFNRATPTGAGPYTYNYANPVATLVTPRLFTFEYGASGASYKLAGGLLAKLGIEFKAMDVWSFDAEILGKAISTVTLANLGDRAVENIRTADTLMYIDLWGGTIGTTPVAATLIEGKIEYETGRHTKTFNSLNPGDWGDKEWNAKLKFTAEFNASAKAIVDALLSGKVQRQVRFKAQSGTKVAQLDFAGTVVGGYELYKDRDGNVTVEIAMDATENTGLGAFVKAQVVNSIATLV